MANTRNITTDELTFNEQLVIPVLIVLLAVFAGCTQSPSDSDAELSSAPKGMEFFHGAFEDALALAEVEDKLVFVDVYTTWCGPCIVMQESVFPLPEVGEYFNARFVNYKLDAENEDQNGPEIAAIYDINVYPTYLILDSEGKELNRASSSMTGEQFVTMVSQMLGETNSSFAELQERYDSGERSVEFVREYLMDAIVHYSLIDRPSDDRELLQLYWEEGTRYKQAALEYFASRPFSDLLNPIDSHLVLYYKDKSERGDELVEFVLEHFEEFLELSSISAMSQFVLNATWYAALTAAQSGEDNYKSFFEDLESEPLLQAAEFERNRDPNSRMTPERLETTIDLIYYRATENWDQLYEFHNDRIALADAAVSADSLLASSRDLIASPIDVHQKFAKTNATRAFELDANDPFVRSHYVRVLISAERSEEAIEVYNSYRENLTDSAADLERWELFQRITPLDAMLTVDENEST